MRTAQIFKYAHKIAKDWNTYKMRKKHNNFKLKYADFFREALRMAYRKAKQAISSTAKVTRIKLFPVAESAKAILCKIQLKNLSEREVWIPKSLINLELSEVATWFLQKNNINALTF